MILISLRTLVFSSVFNEWMNESFIVSMQRKRERAHWTHTAGFQQQKKNENNASTPDNANESIHFACLKLFCFLNEIFRSRKWKWNYRKVPTFLFDLIAFFVFLFYSHYEVLFIFCLLVYYYILFSFLLAVTFPTIFLVHTHTRTQPVKWISVLISGVCVCVCFFIQWMIFSLKWKHSQT